MKAALRPFPLVANTETKYPAPGSSPVTVNSGLEPLVMLDTRRLWPSEPPFLAAE